MSKIKYFISVLLLVCTCYTSFSQTLPVLAVTFIRNGTSVASRDFAVCPNTSINYQIVNWNQNCHKLTVVKGTASGNVGADGTITIVWQDTGDSCLIKITRDAAANCGTAAEGQSFFIPVLSLAKVKPTITQLPPGKFDVGFTHTIRYKASAQYPWLGALDSNNLNDFRLTEFQWTIPSGWSYNGNTIFDTLNVTTDYGTGGEISATAYNRRCFTSASSSAKGISKAERQMPSPCFTTNPPIQATQQFERCGSPIQNQFTCRSVPLNFELPTGGVTYVWSVSPADGWSTILEFGTTAVYKTDGQKARRITVTASAYGVSSSCFIDLPLILANPLAEIKGNTLVCEKDTFSVQDLNLSPGAIVTWNIISLSPGLPPSVSPTSGVGNQAFVSVTGYGQCRIDFTISGCNQTRTLSKTFFAGRPSINNMAINGQPGNSRLVCQGGYHFMTASTQGVIGSNVCLTWECLTGQQLFLNCNTA
jgi:hypothetical protein